MKNVLWVIAGAVLLWLLKRGIEMAVDLENLTPKAKEMLTRLRNYGNSQGLTFQITSGYRSPAYQAELRARWDRGDRAGLVVQPALSSAHTRGNAVDISGTPETLELLGSWALKNGYRWGGTFGPKGSKKYDPVHFDVEV